MNRKLGLMLSAVALALAAAPAQAEGPLAAQDRRDYESVKVRRDRLIGELAGLWQALDTPEAHAAGGRTTRIATATSRELEAEVLESELAALLHRARELRRELLETEVAGRTDDVGLAGRWRMSFGPASGELEMVQTGAILSGSWSLSGESGTFLGHGGNRALLMLIDSRGELFATVRASASKERMDGTFLRSDLASGEPAQGSFSATRSGR